MSERTIADRVAQFMASRDLFAKSLGIELLELRPGYSRASLQLAPHMVNGLGMPHGAILFALADFAFSGAGNSHGTVAVALSMDIHFVNSPAVDARLQAEAVETHLGRRTALYRMTVTDEDGALVAELHGMVYRKGTDFLEGYEHGI